MSKPPARCTTMALRSQCRLLVARCSNPDGVTALRLECATYEASARVLARFTRSSYTAATADRTSRCGHRGPDMGGVSTSQLESLLSCGRHRLFEQGNGRGDAEPIQTHKAQPPHVPGGCGCRSGGRGGWRWRLGVRVAHRMPGARRGRRRVGCSPALLQQELPLYEPSRFSASRLEIREATCTQ